MSLTKFNFDEDFRRQQLDIDRYLMIQRREEELFWFKQLAKKEKDNSNFNFDNYGKFTKKNTKGIYKKLSKGYEKSRSSKNYE